MQHCSTISSPEGIVENKQNFCFSVLKFKGS